MRIFFGACVVALAVGAASAGRAVVPITSCDQKVPAGERGVLQNDIDCDDRCSGDLSIVCDNAGGIGCGDKGSCLSYTLRLKRNAVLDLNGHDVFGAIHAVTCFAPRANPGRCTVKGPGGVYGVKIAIVSSWSDVLVKDVSIRARTAVRSEGQVEIRRSTLGPNDDNSVYGGNGVKLIDVESNADTIESEGDIELHRVELGTGRTYVVSPTTVRGSDVMMTGVTSIKGRDVTLRRATTIASEDHNWGSGALALRRLRLVDSSVTFVESGEEPQLVRSSCEQSYVLGTSTTPSWGVCTND